MTQGIVSILDYTGIVIFKIVAGSGGSNAKKLSNWVKNNDRKPFTVEKLYEAAIRCKFGSISNLVIQQSSGSLFFDVENIASEHFGLLFCNKSKFLDPKFNPQMKCGSADHVEIVTLQRKIECARKPVRDAETLSSASQ